VIHLIKNALHTASLAQKIPGGDFRGFNSIYRSDWEEAPERELPNLSWEWGGGLTFNSFTNPLDIQFDIQAVIKTSAVASPAEGSEDLLKLLWDLDATSEWGLIPWLIDNRCISLPPTPYSVVLTPKVGEPIAEKIDDEHFSFTTLVLIQCQVQRDPRYIAP